MIIINTIYKKQHSGALTLQTYGLWVSEQENRRGKRNELKIYAWHQPIKYLDDAGCGGYHGFAFLRFQLT